MTLDLGDGPETFLFGSVEQAARRPRRGHPGQPARRGDRGRHRRDDRVLPDPLALAQRQGHRRQLTRRLSRPGVRPAWSTENVHRGLPARPRRAGPGAGCWPCATSWPTAPSTCPAPGGPQQPTVIGGRDRTAGGSWCVTDVATGVTAVVLNSPVRRTAEPGAAEPRVLPLLAVEHGDDWVEHARRRGRWPASIWCCITPRDAHLVGLRRRHPRPGRDLARGHPPVQAARARRRAARSTLRGSGRQRRVQPAATPRRCGRTGRPCCDEADADRRPGRSAGAGGRRRTAATRRCSRSSSPRGPASCAWTTANARPATVTGPWVTAAWQSDGSTARRR